MGRQGTAGKLQEPYFAADEEKMKASGKEIYAKKMRGRK
jgi:predicted DNA-binding WGR domain protein